MKRPVLQVPFTIVELLVVIAIIAILASMLLPALARARGKARMARWAGYVKNLQADAGLLAQYDFQDRDQAQLDNSATGLGREFYVSADWDMTLQNSPAWTEGRFPGKDALFFAGNVTNQWTNVDSPPPLTDFTYLLWFRTTATNTGIIGVNNGGAHDRSLSVVSGRIEAYLWDGGLHTYTGGPIVNDNQWHQVAWSVDSSAGSTVYVDGEQVASGTETTSAFDWQRWWNIGHSNRQGFMTGYVDEVQLLERPMTAVEVREHYLMGTP